MPKTPPRLNHVHMKKYLTLFAILLFGIVLCAQTKIPQILTTAPGTVFFEGDPLEFTQTSDLGVLDYTVEDWHGKIIQQGTWSVPKKPLVLEALPCGYYILRAGEEVRSFCVVAPFSKRNFTAEEKRASVLALGVVQNQIAGPGWFQCPWYDGNTYRLTTNMAARAGFYAIRDSIFWPQIQPTRESPLNYGIFMQNADMLADFGIATTCVVHNMPAWTDVKQILPQDLVALYGFAKRAARDFGDRMDSWELWNEPDIASVPEPSWEYAAVAKAAALGYHAGRPDKIVTTGSVALGLDYPHTGLVFDNELYKYVNVYNFHTYSPIPNYAKAYESIRGFLQKYGVDGMAIWCTESGNQREGEAKIPSFHPEVFCHSPEQELIQAEFYPKSQIEHWFNGCSRDYFFILCPYNEANGAKDWGAMRRDGSVKAHYAAMANMTALLTNAKLAGEITVRPDVRVFLFDLPDGSQTICYWAKTELDTEDATSGIKLDKPHRTSFNLRIPAGEYITYDVMGTPGTLTGHQGQTKFTADRFPRYVTGLHDLKADIVPIPQGAPLFRAPAEDEDLTVIIRVNLNDEDFRIENMKTLAAMPKETGRMTIQVWNLSNKTKRGYLLVDGCPLEGVPDSITLPPMGKVEFPVVMHPKKSKDNKEQRLVLRGVFNGKTSTCFVMPYFCESFMELEAVPLACATNPKAWKRNDCANEYQCTWDAQENAIRFDAVWHSDGGTWIFPELMLRDFGESLEGAEYLEFEIKCTQEKVENDVECPYVMLVDGNNYGNTDAVYLAYMAPLKAWEKRRIYLGSEYGKAQFYKMRIGMCPKGKHLTYWIRNVNLLKRK